MVSTKRKKLNKVVEGKIRISVASQTCIACKKKIEGGIGTEFRGEEDWKEFQRSALCQACQDKRYAH